MLKRNERRFTASLLLVGLSCLTGCGQVNCNCVCPVWPVGGATVADELEKAGDLPATWEWIGRLDKLRQELELCQ